jgi:hypothetical protein
MRLLMILPMTVWMLAAAEAPSTKAAAQPDAARAAVAKSGQIPAGAERISDAEFRYKRPDGKTVLYFKTPWGIMAIEEKPASPGSDDAANKDVKATADGDVIRFERPTPFGMFRWQKKKTDLNEMEQAVWQRECAASGAAQD